MRIDAIRNGTQSNALKAAKLLLTWRALALS
jgi:hypothetical protein